MRWTFLFYQPVNKIIKIQFIPIFDLKFPRIFAKFNPINKQKGKNETYFFIIYYYFKSSCF